MDIKDSNFRSTICEFKPEYIFHEAAQIEVSVSMNNSKLDCDVNLMDLINVLDAAVKCGVKELLMPSSSAIYGNLDTLPLDESMIGIPTSFYGLNYICYRYSNVYGPRQGNGGEGGVISIFAKAIANGLPITVYGDGDQTRDFIYVDDVVEANILGLENSITGIYNISTNIASSINSIINEFKCISNSKIDVSYEPERIGDIRHSRLDNKKAQKDLSFRVMYNLQDGLCKTYDYFKGL